MRQALQIQCDLNQYDAKQQFKTDVEIGLAKENKQIPSKYLYDDNGCELFNQISRHPDYYLTACELEILHCYKKQLSAHIGDAPFNLVELGPGEGIKTKILIEQFKQDGLDFIYIPIEISGKYLERLMAQYQQASFELNTIAIQSEYCQGLEWLSKNSTRRNVILFLGSSIGNFTLSATHEFFSYLSHSLKPDDFVLLGFDMSKNINVLMRAYNDADGITRNFNLNLLQRINRELGANFALHKFFHHVVYNPYTRAMESYLVSVESQRVHIEALQRSFTFEEFEALHIEFSYKYRFSQINEFAKKAGFTTIANFTDAKKYFVDTLWQK